MSQLVTCAWCNATFCAQTFVSFGSWFIAGQSGIRFYAPPRSAGGGGPKMEQFYITEMAQIPSARRVAPWPSSRRLCSNKCLKSARQRELRELEETSTGGPIFRAVLLSRAGRRSRSPSRSPSPGASRPLSSHEKYASEGQVQRPGLSEEHVTRLLTAVAQEKLALSDIPRKPRSRSLSRSGTSRSMLSAAEARPVTRVGSCLSTHSSTSPAGPKDMGEWLGLLKVKVIQGDQLLSYNAGEGVISYDKSAANPVCILSWGSLRAMSGCVKQNISPEWDEEFLFDVFQGNLPKPPRKSRRGASYLQNQIQKELQEEEAEQVALKNKYVRILRRMQLAEVYYPPKPSWVRTGTAVGATVQNTDSRMDEYWPVIDEDPSEGVLRVEVIHQDIEHDHHKHLGYADIALGEAVRRGDTKEHRCSPRLESSSEEWRVCGSIVVSYQFEPSQRCEKLRQRDNPDASSWWKPRPHSSTPQLRSHSRTPTLSSSPGIRAGPASSRSAAPDKTPAGKRRASVVREAALAKEEEEEKMALHKEVCVRVQSWDRTNTRAIRLRQPTGVWTSSTPSTNQHSTREKIRLNRLLCYYLGKCQKDLAYRALAQMQRLGMELEDATKRCIAANAHLWGQGGLWHSRDGLWDPYLAPRPARPPRPATAGPEPEPVPRRRAPTEVPSRDPVPPRPDSTPPSPQHQGYASNQDRLLEPPLAAVPPPPLGGLAGSPDEVECVV